ncbi:hypothetical protein Fcan01_28557 [Folsomia candida]|uniref:DUF659 domain-containing protein n=1 Tax=Folsomia candida TaxID=158441 RepID=A0A226CXC3_FOLCA|nr:hypothetical protein Fcan01_28557 [Folsomia candida]
MAGKRANRRKQAKSRLSPLTNSQILDELDNLTTEESTSHEPFPALVLVDSQDISDGQASTFENGDFKISVNQDNPTTPESNRDICDKSSTSPDDTHKDPSYEQVDDFDDIDEPKTKKTKARHQGSGWSPKGGQNLGFISDHQVRTETERYIVFCMQIPFSVIEHPEVIKALRMLNPSYKPPSSKTLGGPLLDKVYNEIVSTAKEKAQSKFATLMQDGWSGLKQAPVISHCINVEAKDAIEEAEEKFGCEIGAVVTDNCTTMNSMRSILSANSDLSTYGCHTHWLNLVGETLRKLGGLQTVLPKRTRWNTQYSCLENFAKNHTIYLDTAKDVKAKTPPEISDILTDLYFYQRVTDLMKKMAPVTCAITKTLGQDLEKLDLAIFQTANLRNAWIKPSLPLFALHIYSIREGLPTIFRERGQVWLAKKNPLYESVQLKLEAGDSNYFVKRLMNKEILRGELALTSSQWWDIMGSQMEINCQLDLLNWQRN